MEETNRNADDKEKELGQDFDKNKNNDIFDDLEKSSAKEQTDSDFY